MTPYQLAKVVSWTSRLRHRKRLQKVVFLLQAAGCPFNADFVLHHYGPYSEDLARLTDEMARKKLLDEFEEPVWNGSKYSYSLPASVADELHKVEQTEDGRLRAAELAPFEAKAKELLNADLRDLEYAATIVYFKQRGFDWPDALEKAVEFKHTEDVRRVLPFAQQSVTAS